MSNSVRFCCMTLSNENLLILRCDAGHEIAEYVIGDTMH